VIRGGSCSYRCHVPSHSMALPRPIFNIEASNTFWMLTNFPLFSFERARHMNSQPSSLTVGELFPGSGAQSLQDTANLIKNEAWGHHASCSNPMGNTRNPMAVMDNEFKVIGAHNLRVVDASVFPRIPGYFPMISIMMISEKASDVILAAAHGRGRP